MAHIIFQSYLCDNNPETKAFFFNPGHLRTESDISEGSSQSEVDRLLRKLSEMTEILEARESKMVEMSRTNLELLEKSTDLASQVKEAKKINARLQEANLNAEEFTQRLSTLEAKHQQTVEERDKLKAENEVIALFEITPFFKLWKHHKSYLIVCSFVLLRNSKIS